MRDWILDMKYYKQVILVSIYEKLVIGLESLQAGYFGQENE